MRKLAAEVGKHTGILLDLQGPKIRLGKFEGGTATLVRGQRFTITTETIMGTAERASTGYAQLANDVKPGDRVCLPTVPSNFGPFRPMACRLISKSCRAE